MQSTHDSVIDHVKHPYDLIIQPGELEWVIFEIFPLVQFPSNHRNNRQGRLPTYARMI